MDPIEAASIAACEHQGSVWGEIRPEIKDQYRILARKVIDAYRVAKKNGKDKKKGKKDR